MLASFDFAPLARRYAQDERWRRQGVRRWGPYPLRCWKTITRVVLEDHIPFHNPVRPERSEAQPSEVEGRKSKGASFFRSSPAGSKGALSLR